MTKLRIGVLVNEFTPEVGGAHNFVQAVASQLSIEDGDFESLEFVLIQERNKNSHINSSDLSLNRSRFVESRLINAYKKASHRFTFRIIDAFNPMSRLLTRNKIDFLLFLGSSPIPVKIPYGVIVWDVQHRTHPWFPELQPGWNLREQLAKIVLPRAAVIITGTEVGRRELVNFYGIAENNVYLIPHPTPSDVPEFDPRDPGAQFNFLYPAQFWPHKNHVVILEALRILTASDSVNVKVTFVGADKGNLNYIQSIIEKYSLQDFVEIRGFVHRSELLYLYQSVDALLYSSFSGPENLPPLEAFKAGIPVLYSEFPGAREQLGNAAVYFNPNDEKQLAEKMSEIIKNRTLRYSLIDRGREQLVGRSSKDFVINLKKILKKFHTFRRSWGE